MAIAQPIAVEDAIVMLKNGRIKIPELQRDYVWKRPQVARLLDSLYHEYPCGGLLLWFSGEAIELKDLKTGLGKGVKSEFEETVVLDGQQRLTSLGRIFDSETPRQDRVLFNIETEAFEVYSPRNASDPRWIDVTKFLTGEERELPILRRLREAGVVNDENEQQILDRLKQLDRVKSQKLPVESVRDTDLEEDTEIFIRINSGGTRLREAELALAKMAWKLPGSLVGPLGDAAEQCAERSFDLDSRFIMRALIAVATGQSRFRDLKAFWAQPAEKINAAWGKTEKALKHCLDFVEGNIGIPGSEFLPSQYALIPLVKVFADRNSLSADDEATLRRWFLVASAFSHYAGSPETVLNQDLNALGEGSINLQALDAQLKKSLRSEPVVKADDLEKAGVNSPFFPLSFLAITGNGAKDWFLGIKLRRDNFNEDQNIEYHHIFPKKLLDDLATDRFLRDELANLAFLGAKANRKIRASKPKDYLKDVSSHDESRLAAQFVPLNRNLWELDRFEDFLRERRRLLAQAMNSVLER
jgi:hypothetical protein